MGYDLDFWREKPGVKLDPHVVYQKLCDGLNVDGLEDLPVKQIMERIKAVFKDGWTQLDEQTWDGGNLGGFQTYATPQFFRVDCYGMKGEVMNKFIDIAAEFGCPLYDPQVGQRF